MIQGNTFEFIKLSLIGKRVSIKGCTFIPNNTVAKIVNVSFTFKEVLKLTLQDEKTMKMFDLDVNNHNAVLTLLQ